MQVLLVVEGTNDIEFLRRISLLLHSQDSSLPDLANMEQRGELIFVPFGGGNVRAWTHRLAPLAKPEFHLYDRELPPETDYRGKAAKAVNRRPHCRALLTSKRSLENYIHPQAIFDAGSIEVTFDSLDPAAEITAQRVYESGLGKTPWEVLTRRVRSQLTHRTKRWLNTTAAEHMTCDLLQDRDPDGEIASWLRAIASLAELSRSGRCPSCSLHSSIKKGTDNDTI
ncbi:MAG: ATP-dependent endonuclease [Planctomycetaceae bacterium]|nr:ATP-dependent endonuclease [Planctomycetaceae bacterium]